MRGIHADPARTHKIHHRSARYATEGPHLSAPSPQRTAVLCQAGTSAAGRAFAARHAEGVFILSVMPGTAAAISLNRVAPPTSARSTTAAKRRPSTGTPAASARWAG